jgi:DNA modification methylase
MTEQRFQLHEGNCLDVLKQYPDNYFDSVVTDPPYGISFMGNKWDYDVPSVEIWKEVLRVLKPGGHVLCFAGTRTQHRMAVNIEDAGFEIRDMISWVYASGMPKAFNMGKQIAKNGGSQEDIDKWNDYSTGLKPACEPVTVARKPMAQPAFRNVLEYGTGALNIGDCRVPLNTYDTTEYIEKRVGYKDGLDHHQVSSRDTSDDRTFKTAHSGQVFNKDGRFPANFIHDGSEEVVALFPDTKPSKMSVRDFIGSMGYHGGAKGTSGPMGHDDSGGSAARFFYCSKANKKDREEGCDELEERVYQSGLGGDMPVDDNGKERDRFKAKAKNHHPTVKPTDLMRYLVRLVTPHDGIVLDPFMGSGSTGKAAMLEGKRFVGCDLDPEYVKISEARISHAMKKKG